MRAIAAAWHVWVHFFPVFFWQLMQHLWNAQLPNLYLRERKSVFIMFQMIKLLIPIILNPHVQIQALTQLGDGHCFSNDSKPPSLGLSHTRSCFQWTKPDTNTLVSTSFKVTQDNLKEKQKKDTWSVNSALRSGLVRFLHVFCRTETGPVLEVSRTQKNRTGTGKNRWKPVQTGSDRSWNKCIKT